MLDDIKTRLAQLRGQFGLDGDDAGNFALASLGLPAHFGPRHDAPARGVVGGPDLECPLCGRHSGPLGSFGRALTAGLDSGLQQALPESPAIDTSLARQFVLRFAVDVTLKEIVKIRYFNTSGHVYDLQSDLFQLYTCNGVLSSNCRCWTTHEFVKPVTQ